MRYRTQSRIINAIGFGIVIGAALAVAYIAGGDNWSLVFNLVHFLKESI